MVLFDTLDKYKSLKIKKEDGIEKIKQKYKLKT